MRRCSAVMDSRPAVNNLSWTVQSGQCWAILGPNGSGKSTLLQLVTGHRRPWPGGEITWFERPDRPEQRRPRPYGYSRPVAGRASGPGASCRDTVLSGLCDGLGLHRNINPEDTAAADDLIRLWGMEDWMERGVETLSYGQFRQIMLARAGCAARNCWCWTNPFRPGHTVERTDDHAAAELIAQAEP